MIAYTLTLIWALRGLARDRRQYFFRQKEPAAAVENHSWRFDQT